MASHINPEITRRMGLDEQQATGFQNQLDDMPFLHRMMKDSWYGKQMAAEPRFETLLETLGDLYKQDPDNLKLLDRAERGMKNTGDAITFRETLKHGSEAQLDTLAESIRKDVTQGNVITPIEQQLGVKMGLDETQIRKLHLDMEDMPYLQKKMSGSWYGDEMAKDDRYNVLLQTFGDIYKRNPEDLHSLDRDLSAFSGTGYSFERAGRGIKFDELLKKGNAADLTQVASELRVTYGVDAETRVAATPTPAAPTVAETVSNDIQTLINGNDALFAGLAQLSAYDIVPFGEMKAGHPNKAEVKELQTFLDRQLKSVDGKDHFPKHGIDGHFNGTNSQETGMAVRSWQEMHNMPGTGIVDASTARAMNHARVVERLDALGPTPNLTPEQQPALMVDLSALNAPTVTIEEDHPVLDKAKDMAATAGHGITDALRETGHMFRDGANKVRSTLAPKPPGQ